MQNVGVNGSNRFTLGLIGFRKEGIVVKSRLNPSFP